MPTLLLLPLGEVDQRCLEYLWIQLSKIFPQEVIIGKKKSLPTDTYDSRRRQYYSSKILFGLRQFKRRSISAVLGVVDVDLYVRGLDKK